MPAVKQVGTVEVDVNEEILGNLLALSAAHHAKRDLFFTRGLVFYTCIDASKNHWTKELKDGSTFLVSRTYGAGKGAMVDVLIRQIK